MIDTASHAASENVLYLNIKLDLTNNIDIFTP